MKNQEFEPLNESDFSDLWAQMSDPVRPYLGLLTSLSVLNQILLSKGFLTEQETEKIIDAGLWAMENPEVVFLISYNRNKEVRKQVDEKLGADVSSALLKLLKERLKGFDLESLSQAI